MRNRRLGHCSCVATEYRSDIRWCRMLGAKLNTLWLYKSLIVIVVRAIFADHVDHVHVLKVRRQILV